MIKRLKVIHPRSETTELWIDSNNRVWKYPSVLRVLSEGIPYKFNKAGELVIPRGYALNEILNGAGRSLRALLFGLEYKDSKRDHNVSIDGTHFAANMFIVPHVGGNLCFSKFKGE